MAGKLDFYYDFSCPFAYLGHTQAARVATEHGAELVLEPILLGGVFDLLKRPQGALANMSSPKVRHHTADMTRWADYWGVPLNMPPAHPRRTVEALRLVVAAPPEHWWPLTQAIYRAYWVDNRDIADRSVLQALATEVGLDGASLVSRLDSPDVKTALRMRTEAAVERGVFGVPTFFVGSEQFWGQDRFDLIARALDGFRFRGMEDVTGFFAS